MKNIVLRNFTIICAFIISGPIKANPALEYDHPQCVQEKVNAHLVLFSSHSLDRYNLGEYYNECGLLFDEDEIYPPAPEECMDSKIDAFRESEGEEAPIRHDVLEEWRIECLEDPENSIDKSDSIQQDIVQQRAEQDANERQLRAEQGEIERQLRAAFENSRVEAQRQAALDANAPTIKDRLRSLVSRNPDVEVGWKSNGMNTWLEIIAIEDRVVLRDIKANRGRCTAGQVDPAIRYDFSEVARIHLGCSYAGLREVEVTTNRGTFTFYF